MSNPLNPKFPSVMSHDFAKVPRIGTQRSAFRCPSTYKTMFDSGKLIPFTCVEVIPGGTYTQDNSFLCRLTTPLVPFMDNLYLDTQYWFVPMRLVWENTKYFWGEKVTVDDTTEYVIPVITGHANGWTVESLGDYFGIPIDKTKNVNALPFRAYNLIYNEFYRDQNIIDPVTVNIDNGPDDSADYAVLRRGKRGDYFTTCLPEPQQGTGSTISLTGDAPITGIGTTTQVFGDDGISNYETDATGSRVFTSGREIDNSANHITMIEEDPNNAGFPNMRADLSAVSAITIAQFRNALQLQALAEIENRGGHRYIEILFNVFNVVSPDFRLQRPEYLGGSSTPIYVVPVPQTSSTSGSAYHGDLAAYATALKTRDGFTKSFTEHGYIIGIMSVRADLTYSQGLHRMWSRSTKYDFFNPFLQNIGDQAVLTQEIFLHDNNNTNDSVIFGYQERFSEYMYAPSLITGKLRPAYSAPLDMWHLSQEFSSAPTLSQDFIEENPPISRVVANTSEPQFVCDIFMNSVHVLPMATHSIPGFLSRF